MNQVVLIRMQSGEDIIANYKQNDDKETIMVHEPMTVLMKRSPEGKNIMIMIPWLPIELLKNNQACIYNDDVLFIVELKDSLIEFYNKTIIDLYENIDAAPSDDEYDYQMFDDELDNEDISDFDESILFQSQSKANKLIH
jgi:hypothetical protein